jgi:hypothetical protein
MSMHSNVTTAARTTTGTASQRLQQMIKAFPDTVYHQLAEVLCAVGAITRAELKAVRDNGLIAQSWTDRVGLQPYNGGCDLHTSEEEMGYGPHERERY